MTCREAIGLLADYLDSSLTEERLREFEAHLAACAPCQAYLKTYRLTKVLAAKAGRVAMPDEMKDRLRQFLQRALRDG